MLRPFVALFVAVAVLAVVSTSLGESPSPSRAGAVRIIRLPAWDAELFAGGRLPDLLPQALVDVLVPLSDIPAEAKASQVLAEAERRTGKRRGDFLHTVQYLRWSEAHHKFIRLGGSGTSSSSRPFMRDIQDGDVLVFHQIICYFDAQPTPGT